MHRTARALVVALVLLAACGSSDADTTMTVVSIVGDTTIATDGSATTVTAPESSVAPTTSTSLPGSSTSSTGTTSTMTPPVPTTKPTTVITQGSTPVTDDSTPVSTERPANASDVTVSASQLFVIGGDTLYLVVEGMKVGKCHRLQYTTIVTGPKVDVDLFSVPDATFCTPSTDYKDSLALGMYGAGSYEVILNGNPVADVDL
jgi:hypothetical protein